jgi:Holliday junction DNA helicase RuvA
MMRYAIGIVKERCEQSITLEVGPLALAVAVSDSSSFSLEEIKKVYLHMHWNAEQGPTLYGFTSEQDKRVFLLLTGCSGIGPKIGLAVLADLGAQRFFSAIQLAEIKTLSKVNGIGTKKAEQIIVQLRDKVAKLFASGILVQDNEKVAQWHTVTQTLESLNYSRGEIMRVLDHLKLATLDKEPSFDQLMRQALSFLAKQP